MTGDKLSISIEGDTSYVSIGDQKAQILRADIALENGVLHVSLLLDQMSIADLD